MNMPAAPAAAMNAARIQPITAGSVGIDSNMPAVLRPIADRHFALESIRKPVFAAFFIRR